MLSQKKNLGLVSQSNRQIVNHIQTLVRNRNPSSNINQNVTKNTARKFERNHSNPFGFDGASSTENSNRQYVNNPSSVTQKNFFTSSNNKNFDNGGKRSVAGNSHSTARNNTTMQQFFAKFNPNGNGAPSQRVQTASGGARHYNHSNLNNHTNNSGAKEGHSKHANYHIFNNPSRPENSFTRKLKENRQAYKNFQNNKLNNGGLNNFFNGRFNTANQNAMNPRDHNKHGHANVHTHHGGGNGPAKPNEFSTPNCSNLNAYHFGRQIGVGAYAVVKECIHKPTGEKVAIKQYDRSKLQDY